MVRGKGFLKIVPFLIGIVVGYIASICLGLVDFTPVAEAAFFSMPNFILPFVNYIPNFSTILTIAPIALVYNGRTYWRSYSTKFNNWKRLT